MSTHAPSSSLPYYDLGSFHRPITTASSECQAWFDRGLVWAYAFNHDEAATCFRHAIAHDACCPMAHWGLALALGPNYNKPWGLFDPADLASSLHGAYVAAKTAEAHIAMASPVEQALITAIQVRYQSGVPPPPCAPTSPPADDAAGPAGSGLINTSVQLSAWNEAYADAMKAVYDAFHDDLDVTTLYAEALINLTPWQLWDLKTGAPPPKARTLPAKRALEAALHSPSSATAASRHPGLLHMYIHLMEMSPHPESALTAADHLRALTPDAGHLRHMPSHIDILVGDYRRAIAANTAAIAADEKYLSATGLRNFYTLYRSHDYHSLIYAALLAGQLSVALDATAAMEASIPESLLRLRSPPMADWLESFLSVRAHVLIRFGRWSDIAALELPRDAKLYSVTTATLHYAKGIAAAAQNRTREAATQQRLFRDAVKRVSPRRLTATNRSVTVFGVAEAMLAGELAYRLGDMDVAFSELKRAVALDDELIYGEPWAWMVPTRHAYAALLLEQGRVEEAAALYRADLGLDGSVPRARQHPRNVWALHGYHECLRRLGRGAEADLVEVQLRVAVAVADVDVTSSCFCRVGCPKNCVKSVL
ncbi:hypothetical protein Dda_3213 [Drechslerella dactyloides]|uniref:TPR domain protein n=1 Tax=Drechslerella dactyloides TaxID=74499 RepID=A0AAD6NLJ8_DREDA|nr:hypothetical protein Dda_3213 [Drechslerella dactyloides]